MRTILVLNPKGGCGKTTIATNLASYYAAGRGMKVALEDFDPQGSSSDWLDIRPDFLPPIAGVRAFEGPARAPRGTEVAILDAPAAVRGKELAALVRRAETLLVPVLPSPIDMRAAARFAGELLHLGRVERKQVRIAIIANRVREYTRVYHELEEFLRRLRIPVLTHLRDTQNYIRAAERGAGIFELAPSLVAKDLEQWEPVLKWLRSKRSLPAG